MELTLRLDQKALQMITLITPTSDRPKAFRLCEQWMSRQTVQFDRWIVADGGKKPAVPTMGQVHLRVPWQEQGNVSLACNLTEALNEIERGGVSDSDIFLIIEDDDYYRTKHIETAVSHLTCSHLAGARWMYYYNLKVRGWRIIENSCSALCNTSFRGAALPALRSAIAKALELDTYHIDRFFWQTKGLQKSLHNQITVIGMKSLPGRKGIGIGHKTRANWHSDPFAEKLIDWIGIEQAKEYVRL